MTTVDQLRVEDNAVNMPLILPSDGNQTESRKIRRSARFICGAFADRRSHWSAAPHFNGSAKLSDFAEALRFTC